MGVCLSVGSSCDFGERQRRDASLAATGPAPIRVRRPIPRRTMRMYVHSCRAHIPIRYVPGAKVYAFEGRLPNPSQVLRELGRLAAGDAVSLSELINTGALRHPLGQNVYLFVYIYFFSTVAQLTS